MKKKNYPLKKKLIKNKIKKVHLMMIIELMKQKKKLDQEQQN